MYVSFDIVLFDAIVGSNFASSGGPSAHTAAFEGHVPSVRPRKVRLH